MVDRTSVKKIVTLGPSSNTERHLRYMKAHGVDFVRVNLSHSSIRDLRFFISLAKKVGIPFMLDTEGSQVRTGDLKKAPLQLKENSTIRIYGKPIKGDRWAMSLRPGDVIKQLRPGDVLRLDFYTLILRITDVVSRQYITAEVVAGGTVGKNKGVAIDTASGRACAVPTLSAKDHRAIDIGLKEGIGYILASFMRSGDAVDEVRKATKGKMKVISKIECLDGLQHLDEIIQASDAILIDRGDLSKEIPLERIPLTQKLIIHRAKKYGKKAIVATNLLETMGREPKPTRAEVHDVINSIIDGAAGLTLAAETAIGQYPIEAVSTLDKLMRHVEQHIDVKQFAEKESKLVAFLEKQGYLLEHIHSSLVPPHGGKLVDGVAKSIPDAGWVASLPNIALTEEQYMDAEQIAIGTFSPLEGFMSQEEIESVLDTARLPNGVAWPIPIVLDVSEEKARALRRHKEVALYFDNTAVGLLYLDDMFAFDKRPFAEKLYGTADEAHLGVRMVYAMQPMLLSGTVSLFHRRHSPTKQYELTPAQTRNLFETRGWSKAIGFHTRNVIHRGHEFIQLKALEEEKCDGLFIHPVIGKKKAGDFQATYILKSYETMLDKFYPTSRVMLGAFATFSRYAGPREALFNAICRKNFGCSHFIVGRDHTGVGNFYHPRASHEIFDQFPDVGIKAITFDEIFYSRNSNGHIHTRDNPNHSPDDKLCISGTEAREMLKKGKAPPAWFMRKEIAQLIINAIKKGERVFE